MLVVWWIATVEIPGHNLFRIAASNWVDRPFPPITVWAFALTQKLALYRGWAVVLIVVVTILHAWLWKRRERWDIYGKWVFKAAFLVLYILLYGIFLLVFIGAGIPIWTWPTEISAGAN